MVGELLQQDRYRVEHVYALDSWEHTISTSTDASVTIVTPRELGRISQLATPNQVLAVVDIPRAEDLSASPPEDGWSLYLDGIQSPSNLGALLRIADWFGFPNVYGGPGTADLYNSKSVQASMGSFLRVQYRQADLKDLVQSFPDLPVYGADLSGQNIYALTPPGAGILVIGAEGPGIKPETNKLIGHRLTIPKAAGRQTESLNAAVAAGILMGWLGVGGR